MDVLGALSDLSKFNPHHDNRGRFTSGGNAHMNVPKGGIGAHTTQYGMEYKWATPAAEKVHARAKAAEPEITKAMKGLEGGGAELVGLDYAVKGKGSLTRKIVTDAKAEGKSFDAASGGIGDSVRYTLQVGEHNYSNKVMSSLRQLEAQGYKVEKFKNYWGGDLYQGINCNLRTPNGLRIELQFHTPTSFHTKEKLNHKAYEEYRLDKTPDKKKAQLYDMMVKNQTSVPVPNGVQSLAWR